MPRTLRAALVAVAALLLVGLGAAPAAAHPLGSFSVSTAAHLVVEPQAVQARVVVDRAEIPTRQDFPTVDDVTGALPGGTAGPARDGCADVLAGARLTADGQPLPLSVVASDLTFPPGAAGLRTARLVCDLRTTGAPGLVGTSVAWTLEPASPAAGWRETTAVGDGVRLTGSTVPEDSGTELLRTYPEDRLSSPLDVRSARLDVAEGTGVVTGLAVLVDDAADGVLPRGADRVTQLFTSLVDRDQITVPFAVLAALGAAALGALHAFAPGHGKTVMAAVLVGRRGTVRDAVLMGASVTVTHTAGVLLLGLALTALGLAQPERAYPLLASASGLLLVGLGIVLLRAARRTRAAGIAAPAAAVEPAAVPVLVGAGGAPAGAHGRHGHAHHDHDHDHDHHHDHHHGHPHQHHHGSHQHTHGGRAHSHALPGGGWRSLVAVGLAGGLVPSPSALVVLLGGIALGRAWFGLGLVVAYGAGMAVALAGTGLLLVRARGRLDARLARAALTGGGGTVVLRAQAVAARLPVLTAALVLAVGVLLTLRAVVTL